ncbi:MAG: alpha-galactosidase [Propionicimonas sp.]
MAEPTRVPPIIVLEAAASALVLDVGGPRLPRILHWGAALGGLESADLVAFAGTSQAPAIVNTVDDPLPVGLLAEASTGWLGTPGIAGSRGGSGFAPMFVVTRVGVDGDAPTVEVEACDVDLGLELSLRVRVDSAGVVHLDAQLRNAGTAPYQLDGLFLNLPIPSRATELLDFTGRWLRERSPQRHPFVQGSFVRTSRRGRTGADATTVLVAGERGFGFRSGEVWAVHTAWSGNHTTFAERDLQGRAMLSGGEALLPGEIVLAPGETYAAPTLIAAWGDGLDALSARFHASLRARPQHPRSARPVTLNTWEAVYFDHDLPTLMELASQAAEIGVERFTLDDGWFLGRRDDTAGLGDWRVDPAVWPDGLHPLADHVVARGMQFGLWVEPEMVNPDSELARLHPEWIMSTGLRQPMPARHQQVLDLTIEGAYDHVLSSLSALVEEYPISYLKWDHNRDLIDPGHQADGRPATHRQTLAVYRLLDTLRSRFPGLEIESCGSGGARVDLAVLQRTDRIWASDCIDPLERQSIQRWTGLLIPPELVGAHIGAPTAKTTGRTHRLGFRAITALFGHLGVEWDITAASAVERDELKAWIALHKRFRGLLHTGTVVRSDHPDPALWLHGVVAADRAEALYAVVSMASSEFATPGRLRLDGLDRRARYRVQIVQARPGSPSSGYRPAPWMPGPVELPGSVLTGVGVQVATLEPESAQLIHVQRVSER